MPAGRPTDGLRHIESLEGSEDSKLRLKAILATLAGDQTIVEACHLLGIGSSRFHKVRNQVLQAALERLQPRPRGRRRRTREDVRILSELRRDAAELKAELVWARTHAEVLEIMPQGRGRRKRAGTRNR